MVKLLAAHPLHPDANTDEIYLWTYLEEERLPSRRLFIKRLYFLNFLNYELSFFSNMGFSSALQKKASNIIFPFVSTEFVIE